METRELYKQKVEAQMHEWSAELDVLKARSEKLTADAKLELKPKLDAVHAKFDEAKEKLSKMAEATDDKWDEFVKELDHKWTDLKAAAEGAYEAIKPHQKS